MESRVSNMGSFEPQEGWMYELESSLTITLPLILHKEESLSLTIVFNHYVI